LNQSAVIVAALLAGFVLYLAAKNRLGVYVGVLWGPAPAVPTPGAATATNAAAASATAPMSGSPSTDEITQLATMALDFL